MFVFALLSLLASPCQMVDDADILIFPSSPEIDALLLFCAFVFLVYLCFRPVVEVSTVRNNVVGNTPMA